MAKILADEGIDFKWYIVGDGDEKENLRSQIKAFGLCDKVVLTGSTENPYSYMKMADVCVQLSEYEREIVSIIESGFDTQSMIEEKISFEASRLTALLSMMEIKGIIKKKADKSYIVNGGK